MADAVDGLEGVLTGLRANVIGKLHPQTQAAWDAFLAALVANDAEPLIHGLILSIARRVLGGLLGGVAAPGVEKSADALTDQLQSDLTTSQGT